MRGALVIGVLGAAGLALGFMVDPRQAWFSYLAAFAFVTSLAVGALFFLCIGHVMRATWLVPLRRLTEAVTGVLPLCALLFVPLVFGLARIYPWVDHPNPHQRAYLGVPFFLVRAGLAFASWIVPGELLIAWSRRQDRERIDLGPRMRAVSAAVLPLAGLTLSFAAIDWIMSLTPSWYSTVFGMLFWAGGFVGSLSLLAVARWLGRRDPLLARSAGPAHSHALGRTMLSFVIFWIYLAYAQGFIIWIANKPIENPWYRVRTTGGWGAVLAVLLVGHFALPFLALLSRTLKLNMRALAVVGALLVVMHFVDIYWMVLPVLHPDGPALHWLDLAALAAAGGFAAAFALARARRTPWVPEHDPLLATGLAYEPNP